MKRYLSILLALALVFSMLFMAACGGDSSSDSSSDGAKSEGDTFIVGFDAEFPPYGYKDDSGEYVGFDLDLAQEVCNRNGWEYQAQPIDWDSKDMELTSGTIDCIWNGFTMNGREDQYTFSDPYVDNTQVIVVKADSGISKLTDLAGKMVAVQTDSSAEACLADAQKELAETFKGLDVEKDYNTCFLNLESGAVDAVAMDVGVANYQLEQRGDAYVILDETLSSEQYGVGFKLGNEALRDQVQATLDEMMEDGTFQEIAEKWGLQDMVIVKE